MVGHKREGRKRTKEKEKVSKNEMRKKK